MKIFVVYGTTTMTARQLCDHAAEALGRAFTEHDSSYWGTYFATGDSLQENLRILHNERDDEDELPYIEYKHIPVILEVNYATEPTIHAIESSIEGLVLLRRTDRDS